MNERSFKRRLGESYMLFKIRSGRGGTFTAELDGIVNAFNRGGILIILFNTYFHWLPPIWILPIIWAIQKAFEYGMGFYDEKHLGWWRFSSDYEQRNINPYSQELLSRIKNIEKKIYGNDDSETGK